MKPFKTFKPFNRFAPFKAFCKRIPKPGDVIEADGSYALREPTEPYGLKFAAESEALRSQNTFLWDETVVEVMT